MFPARRMLYSTLAHPPRHAARFSWAHCQQPSRLFSVSSMQQDFHFDTHHFVQRLEREGLNRAQAEGIMSAMAEVIDESIRNMTSNMVTKADQDKVSLVCALYALPWVNSAIAPLHATSRLCSDQIGTAAHAQERPVHPQGRERPSPC